MTCRSLCYCKRLTVLYVDSALWFPSVSVSIQYHVACECWPELWYQAFQDYYQNVLLKGTSPSTMYVISILNFLIVRTFNVIIFQCLDRLYASTCFCQFLKRQGWNITNWSGCFGLLPSAYQRSPIRHWPFSRPSIRSVDKSHPLHAFNRGVPGLLAFFSLPRLWHWCQCFEHSDDCSPTIVVHRFHVDSSSDQWSVSSLIGSKEDGLQLLDLSRLARLLVAQYSL